LALLILGLGSSNLLAAPTATAVAAISPTPVATPTATILPTQAKTQPTKIPITPTAKPTPVNTPAPPTSPSTAGPAARRWILGFGGSVDFPSQNWNPAYSLGFGNSLELSYYANPHFLVLGLGLDYFHYQGLNFSGEVTDNDLRILPMARFFIFKGEFSSYLTGGAGLAVQFASALGNTATNLNPDGFLGAGFEYRFAPREAAFAEGRYNFIRAGDVWGQDKSLIVGLRSGF
jgi:hypothetical protein